MSQSESADDFFARLARERAEAEREKAQKEAEKQERWKPVVQQFIRFLDYWSPVILEYLKAFGKRRFGDAGYEVVQWDLEWKAKWWDGTWKDKLGVEFWVLERKLHTGFVHEGGEVVQDQQDWFSNQPVEYRLGFPMRLVLDPEEATVGGLCGFGGPLPANVSEDHLGFQEALQQCIVRLLTLEPFLLDANRKRLILAAKK